ncbi:MAG: glutamate--cysteine ligase [Candidatus Caenarcaniphilales bacterium]|nr:glutamate--cysteine ligase [Candidatus Caenarcaniphilales bacterium]
MLLTKGIEVEQYIGDRQGNLIPCSKMLTEDWNELTVEPDQRNIEFITPVFRDYQHLLKSLLINRHKLRDLLQSHDENWTVIPSSTMAMPFTKEFFFSKPEDLYHQFIAQEHGLSVVTTSLHFNIGIEDPHILIRLTNLIRLESSLILALSANSPFYDGQVTGYQSYRWQSFPKVPAQFPFFEDLEMYQNWVEYALKEKLIYNPRHIWTSVRPNGPRKPYEINRLEVRIADIATSWEKVLALMAWIELRVQSFLRQPELTVEPSDYDLLLNMSDANEAMAAHYGLSGHFSDWYFQEETSQYQAIQRRLEEGEVLAEELGISSYLKPIEDILENGNEAAQKLALVQDGYSIADIMAEWIEESELEDLRLVSNLSL